MKKAKMKHKAKRPFKLDFSSQWETHKELFTLELDANDIYEWKVGDSVPEIGHSIMQLEFYGLDFATGGESLLGTVLFDSCDWGLEIHKVVSNAWYEATHPWLDYQDAIKKGCLKVDEDYLTLSLLPNGEYDYNVYSCVENTLPVAWTIFKDKVEFLSIDSKNIVAVKPLKPFEYAYFENVEVWQG